eukprot:2006695-Pyramimonas_sp.AAC.1
MPGAQHPKRPGPAGHEAGHASNKGVGTHDSGGRAVGGGHIAGVAPEGGCDLPQHCEGCVSIAERDYDLKETLPF